MPQPRFTNEVIEAVATLKNFARDQSSKAKAASRFRNGDFESVSENPGEDRKRYYTTNLKGLRKLLQGHKVATPDGWVEGLEL